MDMPTSVLPSLICLANLFLGPMFTRYTLRGRAMQLDQLPDASWETEELAKYAVRQLKEEMNLGRRTLPVMFRAGFALTLLKAQTKGKRLWVKYQKDNGFARTTVNHAERIYNHLKDMDSGEWADWTITQAKVEAGIIKKAAGKKPKPPAFIPAKSPQPLIKLDRAVSTVIEAFDAIDKKLSNNDAFRTLVNELAKLAASHGDVIDVEFSDVKPRRKTVAAR